MRTKRLALTIVVALTALMSTVTLGGVEGRPNALQIRDDQPLPEVAEVETEAWSLAPLGPALERQIGEWVEARQEHEWYAGVLAEQARQEAARKAREAAAARDREAAVAAPAVSSGSGGGLPAVLWAIARCEGYPSYVYRDHGHSTSTASGKFGFLDSTWRAWRPPAAAQYARAYQAPEHLQDQAAINLYNASGTSPWNASRHCWS